MTAALLPRLEREWLPPYIPYDVRFRMSVRESIGVSLTAPFVIGGSFLTRVFGGRVSNIASRPSCQVVSGRIWDVEVVSGRDEYSRWFYACVALPGAKKRGHRDVVCVAVVVSTASVIHSRVGARLAKSAAEALNAIYRSVRARIVNAGIIDVYLAIVIPPWSRVCRGSLDPMYSALARLKAEARDRGINLMYRLDGSGGVEAAKWIAHSLAVRAERLLDEITRYMGNRMYYLGMLSTYIGLAVLSASYSIAPLKIDTVYDVKPRSDHDRGVLYKASEIAFNADRLSEYMSGLVSTLVHRLEESMAHDLISMLPRPEELEALASSYTSRLRRVVVELAESRCRMLRGPPAAS